MTVWLAVIAGAVGCYLLKLAGVSLPDAVLDRPFVHRLAGLLPYALLAALVAVGTFGGDGRLVLDARAAGVAAACVAVVLRAPFIVVLVVGCAVTAGVRALS